VKNPLYTMFGLQGKAALVTGAGSGLGEGIAIGFAGAGAQVALVDIDATGINKVASEIEIAGGKATCMVCDVSNPGEVVKTVHRAITALGKIDILVNNAGIGRRAAAQDMSDEDWMVVLDVNLNGAFYFCRAVGQHMIQRGQGGRIINMASIGGLVGVETGNANYCASKGGMIAMTRCLAIEWAKFNILVNVIAPSHTRTQLIENLMHKNPAIRQYFMSNIPLGRLGEVEDIVGPTIFLASQAAAFITGHVLLVDGGHTAR
jgi:NAD(P)-dependent dehydrogenase (short-subunit alcohol dehydrogenase family)